MPAISRRRLTGIALVLAAATAGCTSHNVELTRACPTGSGVRAAALPKIGLSRLELKLQEKCK